jgi:hypothetical protein
MSKHTTSAVRQMLAVNDCKVFDQHQWHATFTVGQYLCTTCGATYYCPGCTLSIPKGARARLCPEHHAEQEARDHAARTRQSIQKQQKGVPS